MMPPKRRLERLKPKVSMIAPVLVGEIAAPRLRGRRAVERNARFLAEHPVCESCPAPATEVDHTVPLHLGGEDTASNLQALCHDCHRAKTTAEASARANR